MLESQLDLSNLILARVFFRLLYSALRDLSQKTFNWPKEKISNNSYHTSYIKHYNACDGWLLDLTSAYSSAWRQGCDFSEKGKRRQKRGQKYNEMYKKIEIYPVVRIRWEKQIRQQNPSNARGKTTKLLWGFADLFTLQK